MELGPSGFPFEIFISSLMTYQGYSVELDQVLQGECVRHEIDIIARKEDELILVECKYHNLPGIHCDVKIPLYIKARFMDIVTHKPDVLPGGKLSAGWIVTNTGFTEDAKTYGTCAGLYLLGWNYPPEHSLKNLIDASGIYPITCLTTLTVTEKRRLLANKVVLCRQVLEHPQYLFESGIREPRLNRILAEAQTLLTLQD